MMQLTLNRQAPVPPPAYLRAQARLGPDLIRSPKRVLAQTCGECES